MMQNNEKLIVLEIENNIKLNMIEIKLMSVHEIDRNLTNFDNSSKVEFM